jgi:hypothetical protein
MDRIINPIEINFDEFIKSIVEKRRTRKDAINEFGVYYRGRIDRAIHSFKKNRKLGMANRPSRLDIHQTFLLKKEIAAF